MKFLLQLGVLLLRSASQCQSSIATTPNIKVGRRKGLTYSTPPGCNAVLLTLLATMVTDLFKEDEWKLLRCCFWTCSRKKSLEESGKPGVKERTGAAGREFMSPFCGSWDMILARVVKDKAAARLFAAPARPTARCLNSSGCGRGEARNWLRAVWGRKRVEGAEEGSRRVFVRPGDVGRAGGCDLDACCCSWPR